MSLLGSFSDYRAGTIHAKGPDMRTSLAIGSAVVLTLGLAVTAPPLAHAASPGYTIEILPGSSTPGSYEHGHKINDRGDVVGDDGSGYDVLWRAGDRARPVRIANGDYRGARSLAGITAAGVVAGQRRTATDGSESYIWKDGTLSVVAPGGEFMDVAESGVILSANARLWTSATAKTQLPYRNGAFAISDVFAAAVSPNGKVVAGSGQSSSAQRVTVRWNNGVLGRLTTPAGSGSANPNAVNDNGVTVGLTTLIDQKNGLWRPAIWDSKGTPSWLPEIPGFALQEPMAINNKGVAVGRGQESEIVIASYTAGLLWADGKAMKLDDVVKLPAGASIQEASDINASGQITGRIQLRDGSNRAFIATPIDVYTTPGEHRVNGRDWKTSCEKYSQTTRCRTEIQATQVKIVNGRYAQVKGWVFNNLTYLPSPRALWKNNPLGTPGERTIDGRRWKTECDTPQTGRNGCRSSIRASVVRATPQGGGKYTYTVSDEWVFNNIVKFS